MHSFRTGQSASEPALGSEFFAWLAANPEHQAVFGAAMAETSRYFGPLLAERHDFAAASTVCDVGGGNGALLADILTAHPHLRGVLLDLPSVVEGAPAVLDRAGMGDRCEIVAGDFFTEVPAGCDRYVLKSVLHDWDDESCVRLLGTIRAAMPDGARILVLEAVVPDSGVPHPTHAFDLLMLVLTGAGRERTAREWASLFDRAGLRVDKTLDLAVLVVQELAPQE
ncbi:MAG: methyltransferase [Acidimicrobiia bacterium]|nr:methyltransferase [Acidimicrobiia bacterium]